MAIVVSGFFALITIMIIIIVALKHHGSSSKNQPAMETLEAENKKKGLLFQPSLDGSRLIKYKITDMKTYLKYLQHLDFELYEYQKTHQSTSDYVDCTNGGAPEGKACRLDSDDFGTHCTHLNDYGYRQGRPCVLLILKLDNNATIDPFTDNYIAVKDKLKDRWSPDHVGITCDGETDYDREHIGHEDFWYEHGVKEDSTVYNPPTGFPVWFYPQKNRLYKVPAVMVHFNTLRTHHLVTIKCTAWAKSFNNGNPQDSDVYSVRFQLYIE